MNNDTKIKMCKRYDCLYSPGETAHNGCDYFLVTGKYRNCPNGKNCTKYKQATPQEKRRAAMRRMNWSEY